MLNPKVTVISVVRNLLEDGRYNWFLQMVRSVRNQTLSDVELLVVDGASKDGTVRLLRKCEANGWLRFVSEPDSGVYEAMNKGARLAGGTYLAFLNSDDFWHDCRGLEASVSALEASSADFSAAPAYVLEKNWPFGIAPLSMNCFYAHMPCIHQTMLVRRDVFLEECGFDLRYASAADYDLLMRLTLRGRRFAAVDLNFTCYRYSGMSSVMYERSNSENVEIINRRIGEVFDGMNYETAKRLYYDHVIPDGMVSAVEGRVCSSVRRLLRPVRICEFIEPLDPRMVPKDGPWIRREMGLCLLGVKVLSWTMRR